MEASFYRHFKSKFDVVIRAQFSVASADVCNDTGQILAAGSLKINCTEVNVGEATPPLVAAKLAISLGADKLILEGDSLVTIRS